MDGSPITEGDHDRVDVAALLGAGVLAPSNHNSQPWRLRWCGGALEVHADLRRALPAADPDRRELRVACGAVLANVRLAVRAQGRRAHLRLLPDPEDPWFLGVVGVGAPLPATSTEMILAEAIPRRHTDRSPSSGRDLTSRVREEMRTTVQREHAWAVFVDDTAQRRALQELAVEAHAAQESDPAFRAERARWVGTDTDPGAGLPPAGSDEPALLVLATAQDQPLAHLHAGQALQHLLLLASVRGLVASFVAPPVEVAGTRAELRRLLGGALWPQVVLRLGVRGRALPRPPRRWPDEGDRSDSTGARAP